MFSHFKIYVYWKYWWFFLTKKCSLFYKIMFKYIYIYLLLCLRSKQPLLLFLVQWKHSEIAMCELSKHLRDSDVGFDLDSVLISSKYVIGGQNKLQWNLSIKRTPSMERFISVLLRFPLLNILYIYECLPRIASSALMNCYQ